MKISADFDVDENNTVYDAKTNGNPFVEVSINSLKVKEAEGKSIAPADVANYSDNLQLTIDENIDINGLYLASGLADNCVPSALKLYVSAKLDLADASSNNGTELYAYLKVNSITKDSHEEYIAGGEGMPLELSYTKGTLTMRTSNTDSILSVASGALNVGYDMLLAKPVGNLIDNLLSGDKFKAQKETFDNLYWVERPTTNAETGAVEGGKWNTGFQGLTIKNLTVGNILNMLGVGGATTAAEPEETPAQPENKANIYNTLLYVFSLLKSDADGKFSITSTNGIFGTVAKVAGLLAFDKLTTTDAETEEVTEYEWTKEGLLDWAAPFVDNLLGDLSGKLASGKDVFIFDGCTTQDFREILEYALQDEPDALKANFDFTNGIHWDLKLLLRKESETNKEISLGWTSDIKFGESVAVTDAKARVQAIYDELYNSIKDERGEKQEDDTYENPNGAVGQLLKDYEAAVADKAAKEETYNKSATKTEFDTAEKAYKAATNQTAFYSLPNYMNGWMTIDLMGTTIGSANFRQKLCDYLYAKYSKADESVVNAAADALVALFTLSEALTKEKIVELADADLEYYTANIAPKYVAYLQKKEANETSTEYKAYQDATEKLATLEAQYRFTKSRLAIYERYVTDKSADRIAKLPQFTAGELIEDETAYQEALKELLDDYDALYKDGAKFNAALQAYLTAYKDNNGDDTKDTVKDKKADLDAVMAELHKPIKSGITEQMVTDLAKAYLAYPKSTEYSDFKNVIGTLGKGDSKWTTFTSKRDDYYKAYFNNGKDDSNAAVATKKTAYEDAYKTLSEATQKVITKEMLEKLRDTYVRYTTYNNANSAIKAYILVAEGIQGSLEDYFKAKLCAETDGTSVGKAKETTYKGYLDNADKQLLSREKIATAYAAYKEAYDCDIVYTDANKSKISSYTGVSHYKAFIDEVNSYSVWFTLDLAA